MLKLKKIFIPTICLLFFLIPQKTFALIKLNDPIVGALGTSKLTTVDSVISMVLRLFIIIGSLVVFAFFAIGGILYFFAVGNPENENKAKRMLLDAGIGFILLVASYALSVWVVNYVL